MSLYRRHFMQQAYLPEHDRLMYIENTSDAFIDTGYIFKNFDKKIEIRFQQTGVFATTHLCGASSNSNKNYVLNAYGGYNVWVGSTFYTRTNVVVGGSYDYSLEIKDGELVQTVNGAISRARVPSVQAERSFYLFDVNSGRRLPGYRAALVRMYRARIYDGGLLVRDYIPVKRIRDGVVGLLDLIEHKFYLSPNGTKFIGG